MKNFEKILLDSLLNHYYTITDLKVNNDYDIKLNNNEFQDYLVFKENYDSPLKIELPLKCFNSKKIYYYFSKEIDNELNNYFIYFKNYLKEYNSTIMKRNNYAMLVSLIASELDGTLKIEGVNTTRKKIIEIIETKEVKDSNEQIVKNMVNAINYVFEANEFNKENLKKLYQYISGIELKGYYRDEMVLIGNHEGCDVEKIDECMDTLFEYVKDQIDKNNYFLPYIVHYYILYIHPYMDFNGRTARMVELWISILTNSAQIQPLYISEAINNEKTSYYDALEDTRYSNNDLTYFIHYLLKISNKYYFIYRNIDEIKKELEYEEEGFSETEYYYLKKILINMKYGWFNQKRFTDFCNVNITKQAALSILNKFLEKDLLISKQNSKKEKIFFVNEKKIKYSL